MKIKIENLLTALLSALPLALAVRAGLRAERSRTQCCTRNCPNTTIRRRPGRLSHLPHSGAALDPERRATRLLRGPENRARR